MNKDWVWKIFTVVMGALIMPLGGWVWSMNERVIELEAEVKNIDKKVAEAEENARALIGVEKDIGRVAGSESVFVCGVGRLGAS